MHNSANLRNQMFVNGSSGDKDHRFRGRHGGTFRHGTQIFPDMIPEQLRRPLLLERHNPAVDQFNGIPVDVDQSYIKIP